VVQATIVHASAVPTPVVHTPVVHTPDPQPIVYTPIVWAPDLCTTIARTPIVQTFSTPTTLIQIGADPDLLPDSTPIATYKNNTPITTYKNNTPITTYKNNTPIAHYNDAIVTDASGVRDSPGEPPDGNDFAYDNACVDQTHRCENVLENTSGVPDSAPESYHDVL
jgi:hypothetical protein